MPDLSRLTRDEVFAALADASSPVAQEVERLMLQYSDSLASGADPYEILLPKPGASAIESVAMSLMHEALDLEDEDNAPGQSSLKL